VDGSSCEVAVLFVIPPYQKELQHERVAAYLLVDGSVRSRGDARFFRGSRKSVSRMHPPGATGFTARRRR